MDWYDYGARNYEPVLSRFTTMDPLTEKYYTISPYAYCAGNPVMFVDPDGRDVWEVNNHGEIINQIKDKTQDAFYLVAKDADGNYQKTTWTDKDGNEHYNFVTTSHDERKDRSMGMLWFYQLKYGYTLREINHSHPTNIKASPRVINSLIEINSIYKRSRKPTSNIFFVPERKYIPFN